jgi:peroxiredoxin
MSPHRILAMALIGAGLVVIGVAAWLLLPGLIAGRPTELTAIPAQVNYLAPDLSLTDLQGNPVSLSDFRGQTVLVNNWATWCPPCKEEMPELQAYYEARQGQGFTIVAIEAGDPAAEVSDFVRRFGLTFPVWIDPTLKATAAFRNPGLPSSYVIDASGRVRLAWAGAINREKLEQYVTPLLEE